MEALSLFYSMCWIRTRLLQLSLVDECPVELRHETIRFDLDDGAFDRKVKAALAYSPKLALDVEAALAGMPFQGIRVSLNLLWRGKSMLS
jgi:hypothetical protein